MSLENDIKRIADALERISLLTPSAVTVTSTSSAVNFPTDPPGTVTYKTVAELKALAQTIASALPEGGIAAFTDYVRNEICARMGIKKLIEVPADRIAEAAEALAAYAKKE